ncbi:hypothetical protein [Flavobacterium agrisoli]|uniref:6-bladed beta-propeller protein n=1 Tax=Flavobacterium agrisoli TaxID=2793066 RepID=A0A934PN41_9FLAO|nr:hypothetical protein [Flavobacterium agrisoli]MBK0369448.1 hypothetical protein [Flavobacterium agrisoli]
MAKTIHLFLLFCTSIVCGQTTLSTYAIDLKTSKNEVQIINAVNSRTQELFVFIAEPTKVTLLKYNKALFLKDQFTSSRLRYSSENSLLGYSFNEDGNPTLFWKLNNTNIILISNYSFENKTCQNKIFKVPLNEQNWLVTFQNNDLFHLLTKHKSESNFILYVFKNGICEAKKIDFSSYAFQENNSIPVSLNYILKKYPIQKMDTESPNSLFDTSLKSKLYALKDHLILTFDHHLQYTLFFDINLISNTVADKKIKHSDLLDTKRLSNSFFSGDKLFQYCANSDAFSFSITDSRSDQLLKQIKIAKTDSVFFKNSPFFYQKNDGKPRKIKNTKKFLQELLVQDIGLSVYQNRDENYVTFGGTSVTESFISTMATPDLMQDNTFDFYNNGYFVTNSEMVYFESLLDDKLEFVTQERLYPLAFENLMLFLNEHKEIELENIFRYEDYYVLGYYDGFSKQFVMRKFTDGFYFEEKNPVITRSYFSQPVRFKSIKPNRNP